MGARRRTLPCPLWQIKPHKSRKFTTQRSFLLRIAPGALGSKPDANADANGDADADANGDANADVNANPNPGPEPGPALAVTLTVVQLSAA